MKNMLVIGVILTFVFGVFAYLYLRSQNDEPEPGTPVEPGVGFPSAGSGSFVAREGYIVLRTADGEAYEVPDPTNGRPADSQPSGTYYHVTQDPARQEEDTRFGIVYGTDSSIAVGLFAEPLREARLAAEQKLRVVFPGVPDDGLCRMSVTVMVPPSVNYLYAAQNLGLSFCANAVVLP